MADGGLFAGGAADHATRSDAILAGIGGQTNALKPLVGTIDKDGLYPEAILKSLGQAGAFGLHLARHSRLGRKDLGQAVNAMALVSATCMSTGFCIWCQDTLGWYLENTENAALRERLQGQIASGDILGGTGLSNPMKSLANIEQFKLRGRRVAGGYEVSGILPWVSNLGQGHWFGTMFLDGDDSTHRVMAMVQVGQPGVEIKQNAHFIALEGTGTYAVLFKKAFISQDNILADPLGDMPARIKPGFLLLQSGMGLGVTQACIDLMREADMIYGHTNAYLPKRADDFATELAEIRARIAKLAATPHERDSAYMREIFQARLDVSEISLAASQAALLHTGARGYVMGSAVDRRLREAYFVAIITPSIRHLRQELATLGRH